MRSAGGTGESVGPPLPGPGQPGPFHDSRIVRRADCRQERRQCQQKQPGQAGDCEEPAQLPAGRDVLGRHSQEPGKPGIHHEGFYSFPLQSPLPASGRPQIVDTRPAKVQRSCSKRRRPLKTNSAGESRIARFQTLGRGDGSYQGREIGAGAANHSVRRRQGGGHVRWFRRVPRSAGCRSRAWSRRPARAGRPDCRGR